MESISGALLYLGSLDSFGRVQLRAAEGCSVGDGRGRSTRGRRAREAQRSGCEEPRLVDWSLLRLNVPPMSPRPSRPSRPKHDWGRLYRGKPLRVLPSQYFDVETGKHYNYFRDFDPTTGRYSESDPIGLLGGANTYSYVSSRPLTDVDNLGLAACTYSIGQHTLSCKPNPGSGANGASVRLGPNGLFSGAGNCRNNPSQQCQDHKNRGPVPEGDYDMLPYDGTRDTKGNDWWRLRPQSLYRRAKDGLGFGRGGHLLHPGGESLGCVTYSGFLDDYKVLNDLLKGDHPNTLRVTP